MNTKGFTLVELLAVVIILSLLALLTSTSITKLVKDSKDELSETQIKLIESAAKTWGADNLDKLPSSGECSYITLGDLKEYGLIDSKVINASTNEEISNDLKVKLTTTTNSHGNPITNYEVNANNVSGCGHNLYKKYNNGEVVYFDVSEGKKCNANIYTEAQSVTGVKTGCMKFYAFNDSVESKKVNLLLDHNTTSKKAWVTTDTTSTSEDGPVDVLTQLQADTSNWQGTILPNNYTMDQSSATSGANYTIPYKTGEYKARLITTQEIAQIIGNTTWNELSTSVLPLEVTTSTCTYDYSDLAPGTSGNDDYTGCENEWLYNNLDEQIIGYWTSSSVGYTSNAAWYVHNLAAVTNNYVYLDSGAGVRPVIEVSKGSL